MPSSFSDILVITFHTKQIPFSFTATSSYLNINMSIHKLKTDEQWHVLHEVCLKILLN